MTESQTKIVSRLKETSAQWVRLNLFLLLCMVVIRVFFYLQVHFRIEVDASQFGSVMKGTVYDFYLVCHALTWFLIPFFLFHFFFPKTTYGVGKGLVYAYVVVAALLTEYYCNLNMPLDHVILAYSPEEVKGTATSSAAITLEPFLWFFATIAVVIVLGVLWRKVRIGWVFALVGILVGLLVAVLVPYKNYVRTEKHFNNHPSFILGVNQPSYSYIKITDYLHEKRSNDIESDVFKAQVMKATSNYQAIHPEFHFLDPEYPFYRTFDDPDVLGSFLAPTSDSLPPSFVFIIVESFGQCLTGVEQPLFSCTPFIDSLKTQSLYWKNCLSTTQRTFGVLPAIFASAPQGKYGFYLTPDAMPDHQSMIKYLRRNGYGTSYYYGGVHSFDRYDAFLKGNNVDFIYVPDIKNVDSATYEILNNSHRWGLDDRETFRYAMQRKTNEPSPRLNMDIFMTLSTHEPFVIADIKAYENKIAAMVEARPDLSEKERNNILKNKNIFGCYLYLDDCVRELMAFYQTLPEYENTVFFITGDHRMAFLPFEGRIRTYNVPLLVYSPLLRRAKSMDAVVSHLDITPTVNAYLRDNYQIAFDENCHWLGTSFDTVATFRNTRKQAFMLNNRDVVDYIDGDYLLDHQYLFRVIKDFSLETVDDKALTDKLLQRLADYQTISKYACHYNHLNKHVDKAEILRTDFTDFELTNRPIFNPYVTQEEGNHFVTVDSTVLYAPLFEPLYLNGGYEEVHVEFSFDFRSRDTLHELPSLAFNAGDFVMNVLLNSDDKPTLNTGCWEHFENWFSLPVRGNDETLKIFLYNNKQGSLDYDNIKIQVSAEK